MKGHGLRFCRHLQIEHTGGEIHAGMVTGKERRAEESVDGRKTKRLYHLVHGAQIDAMRSTRAREEVFAP